MSGYLSHLELQGKKGNKRPSTQFKRPLDPQTPLLKQ